MGRNRTAESALFARTAETIALLEVLGKVPVPPSRDPHRQPANGANGYALNLRTERHLASTLAFLSSIKDDPLKITAVCVREGRDNGLEVLVAVNANCSSESGYLSTVKEGFQSVFEPLSKAATTSRVSLQQDVLNAIVAMCRSRIKSRARLHDNEERTRFPAHIEEITTRLRGVRGLSNKAPFLKSIRRLAVLLQNYAEATGEAGQNDARLDPQIVKIIQECCILSAISNWENILNKEVNVVRPRIDLSMCRAVIDMVHKMVQYSVSAKTLVDIARRHQIVNRATFKVVRLDKEAFRTDMDGQGHSAATTAREAFSRATVRQGSNIDFDNLRRRIHTSEQKADEAYKKSLKNALQNSRVHAEMQLIWYLDSHPSLRPPRIMASHKDACYLCNAFMAFHGMYTIPRSHGRLYPGWKLPTSGLREVREGFVRELESRVILQARKVLSGAKRLEDPRESRVNSTVTLQTSIMTVDEDVEAEDEALHGSTSDAETIRPETEGLEAEISSSGESSDVVVAGAAEEAVGADTDADAGIAELGVSRVDFADRNDENAGANVTVPDAAPASAKPNEQSPSDQPHIRSEGDASWQTVEQGQTVTLRLTPKLRIHIEYSASDKHPSRRLKFRIRELSEDEIAAMDANCDSETEKVHDVHRDLPALRDVFCRENCRSVCLQVRRSRLERPQQQRSRRFRVELG